MYSILRGEELDESLEDEHLTEKQLNGNPKEVSGIDGNDLRKAENKKIKLEKKRSSADNFNINSADPAERIKFGKPVDKTFFAFAFNKTFKRLKIRHSSERNECTENYAEENRNSGKDKGIAKAF